MAEGDVVDEVDEVALVYASFPARVITDVLLGDPAPSTSAGLLALLAADHATSGDDDAPAERHLVRIVTAAPRLEAVDVERLRRAAAEHRFRDPRDRVAAILEALPGLCPPDTALLAALAMKL